MLLSAACLSSASVDHTMLNELPAEQAYRIIEYDPIVLVAKRGIDGLPNLMLVFYMMMQHDPPLVGAIIGPRDYSHQALSETGECVLAVSTVDLAETVVDIGNCSGDALNMFVNFGLTPASAQTVDAPLVRECWANLECHVTDDGWARHYNLCVLEVQCIWIDTANKETRLIHHQGDGHFSIDGNTLDLGDRMVKWRYLRE